MSSFSNKSKSRVKQASFCAVILALCSQFNFNRDVVTKIKKSIKAALLSGFVYPGMGHLFLKQYALCVVFFCAFSLPLYFIISDLLSKTEQIIEQILNGDIPLDVVMISHKLSILVVDDNAQALNIKMYALIAIWLVGIIDSYRLGRK
jgi:hypothetical protein